jgi:hypothetical protein
MWGKPKTAAIQPQHGQQQEKSDDAASTVSFFAHGGSFNCADSIPKAELR